LACKPLLDGSGPSLATLFLDRCACVFAEYCFFCFLNFSFSRSFFF
jgi:hypothetical protein